VASTGPVERPPRLDLADDASVARWCEHLGVTREQLEEAVAAVGDAPDAVVEHLLHQGGSAGAG
jgi:hypothetical protein